MYSGLEWDLWGKSQSKTIVISQGRRWWQLAGQESVNWHSWQGRSSGAWRSVDSALLGVCTTHTLGRGQCGPGAHAGLSEWLGFPFAGPGLGGCPSGHHVSTGIFVPRKRQKKGRERADQPPFSPENPGSLVSSERKSPLMVQKQVPEDSLGREKGGRLLLGFHLGF